MKELKLLILPDALLEPFCRQVDPSLETQFKNLQDADISTVQFSFYTSVASVFSSKIEGENIELDSYVKYKRFGIEFLPDYTKKTDDLYSAYLFAQQSPFNRKNVEEAHVLLAKHLVPRHHQGKIRKQNMYVTTPDGRIEYVAATPDEVVKEMKKLYADIDTLIAATLNIKQTFFFAGLIHLVFVKIHPFTDGNGRTARLLEKWFLAEKLGEKAWYVQSEKLYYHQHQTYYKNIRALGLEYQELDYNNAMPFLLMLPQSLLPTKGHG